MADFRRQFGELIRRQNANLEQVARRSAIQLAGKVIEMSPVDTGRFRGNWFVETGRINTATTDATDKSGAETTAKAVGQINGWKPTQAKLYITNSLPYAKRLEEGYSGQAPLGMVKVTVAQFQDAVRAALKGLK